MPELLRDGLIYMTFGVAVIAAIIIIPVVLETLYRVVMYFLKELF